MRAIDDLLESRIFCFDVRLDGDAYVMSFSGYGLILGMDWLSLYGAVVRGGSSD